jgi:hypothetical protein
MRFPAEFMFRLTAEEVASLGLRSHFATSNGRGGRRFLPYAFTEHGVVMLSSVLNSERAVAVSILVVNAFVRMRELIAANQDLATRVAHLEQEQARCSSILEVLVEEIHQVAEEVDQMKALPPGSGRKIGFPG